MVKNIIFDLMKVVIKKDSDIKTLMNFTNDIDKAEDLQCLFIDDDDTGKSLETANRLGILGRKVKPNDSQDVLILLKEYKIEI